MPVPEECPVCSAPLSRESRFCPECATRVERDELEGDTQAVLQPTEPKKKRTPSTPGQRREAARRRAAAVTMPGPQRQRERRDDPRPDGLSTPPGTRPGPTTPGASGADAGVRFGPGMVVAGRYRIVGLLGRGGMGEVYRADDLKLGEAVALKFLPEKLVEDGAALARFHREVKVARRIAHPNVCRVYDIGEVDGQPFISMEYIDGEDLESLLLRIGRLPEDKALQIARQLCAGLAAAHDQGVLHRDLKPANVMIDGRGRARISDFGIAALESELGRQESVEGTPAYQAPEQLAGREVTVRSDVYALGLTLFEVFTGRRPFPAKTRSELADMQRAGPPAPSGLVAGIDPVTETAILKCLRPEPSERPQSALRVSALLPGGDPLAAALAAGETPSPEMVAAAPRRGTLSPLVAVLCLVGVVVGLGAAAVLQSRVSLEQQLSLELSPGALAFRAEQVVDRVGLPEARDRAWGWSVESQSVHRLAAAAPLQPRPRPRPGRPPLLSLWYRTSPEPLRSRDGYVRPDDPPLARTGEVALRLDLGGRLWRLERVPERAELETAGDGAARPEPADWEPLFLEAGLDPAAFRPVEPRWEPPQRSDLRLAWSGGPEEVPLRVEAAALRGEPVWFEVMQEDVPPDGVIPTVTSRAGDLFWWFIALFYVLVIGASLILAPRNLRQGRGDRRGAFRVALVMVAALGLEAVVASHHAGGLAELEQLMRLLAMALFQGACLWLAYIALEPVIRRRWPQRIIAWSRALGGELADPMVGREVVVGSVIGLGMALPTLLALWVLPLPEGSLYGAELVMWLPGGWTKIAYWLGNAVRFSLIVSVASLLFVVLLSMLLHRLLYAATVFGVMLALVWVLGTGGMGGGHPLLLLSAALSAALFVVALARFGLLAATVAYLTMTVAGTAPLSLDPSSWLFPYGLTAGLLLLALAGWGFAVSLGDRLALGAAHGHGHGTAS